MRWAMVGLVLAVAVGCGDDGDAGPVDTVAGGDQAETDEAAVAAFRHQIDLILDGQYGRAYELIHPAQQEIIDRATYERCTREGAEGVEVVAVEVEEVFHEDATIPGTDLVEPSTAITATLTFERGIVEQDDTTTYHQFYVDGTWRFTAAAGAELAEGDCG